ncbi:MAG: rod shape-determining protein MreC [Candidatus Margulisbacteria bacterium]|nr:rod shape-determining protein MreC [Candidatus Margulisiibacteriota bacterium]
MIRFKPYRKKNSPALALIIILLAVFLSFSAFRNILGLRTLLVNITYPFQFITVSAWKGIVAIPGGVANLTSLAKQNAELKNEVGTLKARLLVLEELRRENDRLKSALLFEQGGKYRLVLLTARVTGKSPATWFSILTIDRGGRDGIKKGLPVIAAGGLAGQIIEVAQFSSKVLLVTDGGSAVAAVSARSRDHGIVAGSSSNKLIMKYVSAGGDVKEGDPIVTSPLSTVYPAGIPIGTVTQASKQGHDLFYHIEIDPAVDFSKLEEVFIVL